MSATLITCPVAWSLHQARAFIAANPASAARLRIALRVDLSMALAAANKPEHRHHRPAVMRIINWTRAALRKLEAA